MPRRWSKSQVRLTIWTISLTEMKRAITNSARGSDQRAGSERQPACQITRAVQCRHRTPTVKEGATYRTGTIQPGVGHLMMLEDPAGFLNVIGGLLPPTAKQ